MELRNSFLTTNNMLSSTTTTTNTAAVAGASSALRASNLVALSPNVHALGAQFREIHKNTWLKRLTAEGKKITVGPKKSERSWVVFCVHDDTEALLEGYAEPRQAPAHSPEWIVSLRNTLHVSHALIPNSHEFEFVVALNNEVVRFHATSWEIMQEWVETLRAKLREMKILSPRENLYTKLPEVRMPLLPTRDPTSPLPAPPPVPAALVPGVERVVTHNNVAEITETITTTTNTTTTTGASTSNGIVSTSAIITTTTTTMTAMSNTLTQNLLNMLTDPITAYSENLNATLDDSIVDEEEEDNDDDDDDDDDIENIEVELRQPPNDELSLMSSSSKGQQRNSTRVSIKAPTADLNCDNLLPRISTTRTSVDEAHITELQITGNQPKTTTTNTESSTNITIIEVSAAATDNQEVRKTNAEIFQFPEIKKSNNETNDYKCNVQIIPSNSINGNNNNNSTVQILPTSTSTTTTVHVANTGSSTVPVYGTCFAGAPLPKSPFLQKRIIVSASSSSGVTNITVNDKISNKQNDKKTTAYYDKVFLSTSHPKTVATQTTDTQPPLQPQPSSSRVLIADSGRKTETNITERQPTKGNNYGITVVGNKSKTQLNNEPTASSRATATSPITVSTNEAAPMGMPRLMRGATEAVITRASRRDAQLEIPQRSRVSLQSRNRSNKNAANNNDELVTTNKPTTTAELELRKSIMQQRRRSASTSDAHTQRNARNSNNNELTNAHGFRMQPPPHVTNEALINSPKRLTLREQQVMQLRREIMHPGGVRLQLRRKDCVGSIAWVDCLNTVWIAGWKQKEHPVLYNALHIGDQLLSIAGMPVSTAAEANKIIRNTNTLFVEVLVRRIPFGRGYAIRREREGQCLGLIRDGNTATIVDVVPNSLAARHGLPPKAPSCDGNALTFWNLTEINGRPLNLFFKENEIRDRLNSVGRDISILVQPADLISKLKKQLKSLRGYKDYLVQ